MEKTAGRINKRKVSHIKKGLLLKESCIRLIDVLQTKRLHKKNYKAKVLLNEMNVSKMNQTDESTVVDLQKNSKLDFNPSMPNENENNNMIISSYGIIGSNKMTVPNVNQTEQCIVVNRQEESKVDFNFSALNENRDNIMKINSHIHNDIDIFKKVNVSSGNHIIHQDATENQLGYLELDLNVSIINENHDDNVIISSYSSNNIGMLNQINSFNNNQEDQAISNDLYADMENHSDTSATSATINYNSVHDVAFDVCAEDKRSISWNNNDPSILPLNIVDPNNTNLDLNDDNDDSNYHPINEICANEFNSSSKIDEPENTPNCSKNQESNISTDLDISGILRVTSGCDDTNMTSYEIFIKKWNKKEFLFILQNATN
ncbi:uncharacterized protein DDB_G0287625-like [Prorops nasuta]|uniref:uncharacterized protein DDB_G0287625-like n=1 Tax=Prorops nasuta TaxID=863751 RepID=UPI0034CF6D28